MHRARCVLPVAGVGPNPADQGGTGLGGGPFDESVGVLHPVPRGAVSEDLSGMTACRCGGMAVQIGACPRGGLLVAAEHADEGEALTSCSLGGRVDGAALAQRDLQVVVGS